MSDNAASARYTGSCLCEGVQYELTAEPGPIEVCYCRVCRKTSGGPLATNASRADRPEVVRVRVGAINEPLRTRPVASYHTGSKCDWWEIHDCPSAARFPVCTPPRPPRRYSLSVFSGRLIKARTASFAGSFS
jgi:hypothetical protein